RVGHSSAHIASATLPGGQTSPFIIPDRLHLPDIPQMLGVVRAILGLLLFPSKNLSARSPDDGRSVGSPGDAGNPRISVHQGGFLQPFVGPIAIMAPRMLAPAAPAVGRSAAGCRGTSVAAPRPRPSGTRHSSGS